MVVENKSTSDANRDDVMTPPGFAEWLSELPSTPNAPGRIVYMIDQDLFLLWLNKCRRPRIAIAEATRRIGIGYVDSEYTDGSEAEPPYHLMWPNPDCATRDEIRYWDDLDLLQIALFDERECYSFANASRRFEIIVINKNSTWHKENAE
jgi:hypothetical protein